MQHNSFCKVLWIIYLKIILDMILQKAYRVDFNGSYKKDLCIKNSPKHLLGIQNLSILEAQNLDEAKAFIKLNRSNTKKLDTKRKTQINLFFEPSTRTQSFLT